LVDAAKLREAISGTTTTILVDAVVVTVLLAVLWVNDLQLALVVTMLLPLFVGAVGLNHAAARRCAREAMDNGAHLSAHMIENIAGVETIKVFGAERLRTDQAETRTVAFAESLFAMQKLELRLNAIALMFTNLTGLVVLWYGGKRVMDGALTIGQLLFFYSLLTTMLEPLGRLANITLRIQDALVATDRLFQILDLPTEPRSTNKLPLKQVERGIELRDVCFSYGNRKAVLSHINLTVPAGKTVAIVGESGSGKSTLLKLLLQYYQPSSGRLTIDGVDLRDFDIETLRARIGVVTQDPYIFNGMIRENIALGQPAASLQEIMDAARAAGMDEFVSALPHRYDTSIGERGATLSGGQRQRLAIARALVSRPEVLIFDEATSHLDTATERLIQENLRTWLDGRTAVIVAHRLSTIKDVDIIYVLHEGCVVEQGTHAQLLAEGGRYADLWAAQSGAHEPLATLGSARLLDSRRLSHFRTEI
jgi:ATP-binding cassette subfamily B protein